MNKPNNKRKKESQEKIEKIFVQLIQTKEMNEISITDICKKAHLNRSTFYANYIDIYDLADKIREKLEIEVDNLYKEEKENNYNSNNFLKLFENNETPRSKLSIVLWTIATLRVRGIFYSDVVQHEM